MGKNSQKWSKMACKNGVSRFWVLQHRIAKKKTLIFAKCLEAIEPIGEKILVGQKKKLPPQQEIFQFLKKFSSWQKYLEQLIGLTRFSSRTVCDNKYYEMNETIFFKMDQLPDWVDFRQKMSKNAKKCQKIENLFL